MRVATYNVHGCVGTDRRRSEERIASVIRELAPDVIGLQEVDRGRRISGGTNQAEVIAQLLGWHHCYHPATARGRGDQGHAVLSRFPLRWKRAAKLPGRAPRYCNEDRAALAVEVATDEGLVLVISTHFGLGRAERCRQAEYLTSNEWLSSPAKCPTILLGDLNCLPGSRPHRVLSSQLIDVRALVRSKVRHRTHPTFLPALEVDYIFVTREWRALGLFVHRSPLARIASDHFPLVADLCAGKSSRARRQNPQG